MAIDPATIKLATKVALKTITDEDSRNNLIIGIVVGIIVFILIILTPLFIILSPLDMIKNSFVSDNSGNITDKSYFSIVEMKENYENQNLEVGKFEYNGGIFPLPVENPVVTSEFGTRIHPVTKKQSFHTGIDLAGVWHSNIMSVEDGKIIFAGVKVGYGNCIIIEHKTSEDKKYYTLYGHLATINVINGQEVIQGNVIGTQGGDPKKDPNPGYSTGTHLHFEIRLSPNGDYQNPRLYLFGSWEGR